MNKKFILGFLLSITFKSYGFIHQRNSNVFSNTESQFKTQNIVVAVIDTGADLNHRELKKYFWVNEGETGVDALGVDKSINQIDDDGNGFVDDVHGWNFITNTNKMSDEIGHGTHISGIIKNQFLKSGSEFKTNHLKLMILKYYNEKADDKTNLENSNRALRYALQMNADIINYSGGGSSSNSDELQILEQMQKKNVIVVAAAGNNKSNTDNVRFYPANYNLPNIISVAAINNIGSLMEFSNYGPNTIDIAAPGQYIYSTLPKNKFGFMSGTSQSTAFVTGQIAGINSNKNNYLTASEALNHLLRKSPNTTILKGKVKYQMALLAN